MLVYQRVHTLRIHFSTGRLNHAGGRPHHRGQRLVAERWRGGAGAAERQQGADMGISPMARGSAGMDLFWFFMFFSYRIYMVLWYFYGISMIDGLFL